MRKASKPIVIALITISAIIVALFAEFGVSFVEKQIHPIAYEEFVEKYSAEYNIPEYIIYAIINVESGFDPDAASGEANGLMQIAPATFKWLTSAEHLNENLSAAKVYDPETNIRYGCYYLRYLFKKFYNWNTVFAAYNAGEGRVTKWLSDPRYSDGKGNLTNIPIEETAKYVKKVNKEIKYYKDTYYKNSLGVEQDG